MFNNLFTIHKIGLSVTLSNSINILLNLFKKLQQILSKLILQIHFFLSDFVNNKLTTLMFVFNYTNNCLTESEVNYKALSSRWFYFRSTKINIIVTQKETRIVSPFNWAISVS